MRVRSIDIIRGFAVLGLLYMNVSFHFSLLTGYVPFDPPLFSDQVLFVLQGWFADSRFRSLFCLMFGVGVAILYERAQWKGYQTDVFLKSRFFWLLMFGFIHAIFIFGGDILTLYSICGFILINQLNKSQPALLMRSLILLVVGSSIGLVFGFLDVFMTAPEDAITRNSAAFATKFGYVSDGYLSLVASNVFLASILITVGMFSVAWQLLGIMLFGTYLYREGFFHRGFSKVQFRGLLLIAVAASLLTTVPFLYFETLNFSATPLFASVSGFFVALVYAHIGVKLMQTHNWFVNTLENCGRIALSLYILQSLSMLVLFKVILPVLVPNYHMQFSLADHMGIAVIGVLVQMVIANWYAQHNRKGPLESLWRVLYMQRYEKKIALQNVVHPAI